MLHSAAAAPLPRAMVPNTASNMGFIIVVREHGSIAASDYDLFPYLTWGFRD